MIFDALIMLHKKHDRFSIVKVVMNKLVGRELETKCRYGKSMRREKNTKGDPSTLCMWSLFENVFWHTFCDSCSKTTCNITDVMLWQTFIVTKFLIHTASIHYNTFYKNLFIWKILLRHLILHTLYKLF